MKRAAHQRPMPTRARLTASARGDGLIPVQRTRRAEGGNQARPPFSRARAWAPGRFPAFRAYLKTGEPSSNTSHHETGREQAKQEEKMSRSLSKADTAGGTCSGESGGGGSGGGTGGG